MTHSFPSSFTITRNSGKVRKFYPDFHLLQHMHMSLCGSCAHCCFHEAKPDKLHVMSHDGLGTQSVDNCDLRERGQQGKGTVGDGRGRELAKGHCPQSDPSTAVGAEGYFSEALLLWRTPPHPLQSLFFCAVNPVTCTMTRTDQGLDLMQGVIEK